MLLFYTLLLLLKKNISFATLMLFSHSMIKSDRVISKNINLTKRSYYGQ